jgi:hypothetical protein
MKEKARIMFLQTRAFTQGNLWQIAFFIIAIIALLELSSMSSNISSELGSINKKVGYIESELGDVANRIESVGAVVNKQSEIICDISEDCSLYRYNFR